VRHLVHVPGARRSRADLASWLRQALAAAESASGDAVTRSNLNLNLGAVVAVVASASAL